MAILLGFLTLLTTLIRIILKLANQFYKNESILVMKNKYLSYNERVARQVFIIFISNTNNLETSSADLNTSLLFGSATLERKRDAAKTIRYI